MNSQFVTASVWKKLLNRGFGGLSPYETLPECTKIMSEF